MMTDYEFIFSNKLKEKLNETVYGGVKTWVTKDELHVSIRLEECGVNFEYVIPDISDRILNSFTTDYAVYEVMREYKSYLAKQLRNRFFK